MFYYLYFEVEFLYVNRNTINKIYICGEANFKKKRNETTLKKENISLVKNTIN